ncbi:CD209 antigen-like protein C [Columba livia]|uniref:CD209 antigen-like protein C n=1 Tax=Columba livia TaxID=8932 RepID=A0A2I0LIT9_COLLI|nr:CD209 antigen-like protein C isoform X1 [Columba livia]PKK17352.1 CD209 antigen-like protein C [Columba livia]
METYGNWLGPPGKRPLRQTGIYSVAGKMTPMGDFRPASPDSFDDDYDDVSLSESNRGPKLPATPEDPPRSKSSTGVYTLAGKPASPNPPQNGNTERGGAGGRSRGATSVAILYFLVALSFVAWVLLFAVGLVKQMEMAAELKLLRSNFSESQADVRQELRERQREQTRLRSGMQRQRQELQDIAALICRSVPDGKKCSAGWQIFEKSCYFFSSERANWADAGELCADQDAHLVIVDSEREQGFLVENVNSSGLYWLGVTDQLQEGNWVWTNGDRTSISYWDTWTENKDKEQEDCGAIGAGGVWSDERCSRAHRWICEKAWNC